MARHLAGCATCQRLRRATLDQLLPGAAPEDSCAACAADLAAYIDALLDQGAGDAAQSYPQAWWHLWGCPDCADLAGQITLLARAERAGELAPLPVGRPADRPARRLLSRITVAPAVIARVVQRRQLLGVAYGGESPTILDEETDGDHSFQLSLRRESGGSWELRVMIAPPAAGCALIVIGAESFRAPFDAQGVATIAGLSAALLSTGDPALAVSIEAE